MQKQKAKITIRTIIQMLVYIVLIPFLPLLVSRRWGWWEAWVYAFAYVANFIVSRVLVARIHPDLIEERGKSMEHKDNQPWDNVLAPLVGLGGNLIQLTAGLEALYGELYPISLAIKLITLVLFLAGYAWGTYALLENRFFSGTVRLQSERGHHVISSGPYHIMRHPGYVGALVFYFATPIFLGSLWAFVPVLFFTVVMVIRTRLEDRFLQESLPGYAEYAQQVRWRLIPGFW
jgi:protein-S-isoprenylcysteine O-methyltransferase Ste14